jgi:hypothetical protein
MAANLGALFAGPQPVAPIQLQPADGSALTPAGLAAGLSTPTTTPTTPLATALNQIVGTLPQPAVTPTQLTSLLNGTNTLGAPPASNAASVNPFATIGGQPLDTNAPTALKQYAKKYSTLLPQLQAAGIQPMYLNALAQLDAGRVSRGSAPLTTAQTLGALQTAITHQAATPSPKTSWWDLPVNAYHDLSNIVSSVPEIPATLIGEAEHFGQIPGDVSTALATSGGIGAKLKALSGVPGINLIPGVHTAADVLSGDFGDIARHPVSTLLDVLPASKELGVGEAISDSAIGDAARSATDTLGSTRIGQIAQQLWGSQSRQMSIMASGVAERVKESLNPAIASPDLLDNIAKDSVKWAQDWHAQIAPDRVRYLTDAAESGTWATDPTLTPPELAALHDYRDIAARYAQYGEDNNLLTQQQWLGGQEVFTPQQAKQLLNYRAVQARYEAFTPVANALRAAYAPLTSDARFAALTDTPDSIRSLVDNAKEYINSSAPATSKRALLQGLNYVYDTYGYQLPDGYKSLVNSGQFAQAHDLLDTNPIVRLDNPPPPDQLASSPWLTRASKYTDAGLARVRSLVGSREIALTPARWSPVVEDAIKSSVGQALTDRGFLLTDNPNYDLYNSYVQNGLYQYAIKDGLITSQELSGWMNDARQAVLDAKQQGLDPLFMHRIGLSQVQETNFPKPLRTIDENYIPNPTQVRARTLASAPYVHDLAVGLTHQGLEWLNLRNAKSFLQDFLRTTPADGETVAPFARTEADLRAQYNGSGTALRTLSQSPFVDHDAAVRSAIQREWVKYPVETLPQDVKQALGVQSSLDPNAPWLPKPVMNNLKLFINPPELPRAFDLPTTLFRNSVLGLSPRFLLNHLVGGFILTSAESSPLTVMKYLSDARDIVNAAHDGDFSNLPESFRSTFGSVGDPLIEWNISHGGKLADMTQAFRENPAVQAVSHGTTRILDSSYNLVSHITDMYRTINYLYGHDEALKDGLSETEAQAAGEQLARKVILSWDNQTPLERVALKSVLPFYGFTQQILRYAYHYPIDHPFRAAVVASVARTELNDLGTGLPQSLLGTFMLGHPDAQGNVKELALNTLNPFKDVANYMTLAGLLSGSNPIISTALEQLGVNLQGGGTNLYPNVSYDAQTGKLTASHPNPITNFLYNTIPQTQILTGLLSKGSELKALLSADPSAASRLVMSQAGLPVIYQTNNIIQQQYKDEVNRETAQSTALSNSLKSGNWRGALAYPQLAPVLGQVQQLQSDNALDYYNTGEQVRQIQQLILNTIQGGGTNNTGAGGVNVPTAA